MERRGSGGEPCSVCGRPIRGDDPVLALPGRRLAHAACAAPRWRPAHGREAERDAAVMLGRSLIGSAGKTLCVPCAASMLVVAPDRIRAAFEELRRFADFAVRPGLCALCAATTTVIWAWPPTDPG